MASRRIKTLLTCALCTACMHAVAEEQDWRVEAGVSHRNFSDIEFAAFAMRHYGNTDATAGPLGLQSLTNANTGGYTNLTYAIDHAAYNGSDVNVDSADRTGIVLAAERRLKTTDKIEFSLVSGLQVYHLQQDACDTAAPGAPGRFTTFNYVHSVILGIFNDPKTLVPPAAPVPGLQAGTQLRVDNDLNLDLFVLDLGIKAAVNVKNVRCYCAAGPTVSIADTDTSQTVSVQWTNTAVLPVPYRTGFSESNSQHHVDVVVGGYAAVGAAYDFNERLGVAAECRYDAVTREVGTSQADVDLNGVSGLLKAVWRF